MSILFHVLWNVIRRGAKQIRRDQNFSVTEWASTNSNGRDGNLFCDLAGDRRGDEFQDNRKRTGLRQRERIGEQGFPFWFFFSFDMVAAFFNDALRQHPEVSEKRNSGRDD